MSLIGRKMVFYTDEKRKEIFEFKNLFGDCLEGTFFRNGIFAFQHPADMYNREDIKAQYRYVRNTKISAAMWM